MNTVIRFIKPEEIDELVELCKLHATYEEAVFTVKGKEEKLNRILFGDIPSLYCLVALMDGKIVGYATYAKQISTWDAEFYVYMDCLFLKEKSRGFGLGEKLIKRIKEETKRLDCKLIQWQTPDFNTRAIKFYKRIGADNKAKTRFFLNSV